MSLFVMFQHQSQVRVVSQARTICLFVLIMNITRFHLFRQGFSFLSTRTVRPTFMTLQKLFFFEIMYTGLLSHMRKNDVSLISCPSCMIVVKCFQLKNGCAVIRLPRKHDIACQFFPGNFGEKSQIKMKSACLFRRKVNLQVSPV